MPPLYDPRAVRILFDTFWTKDGWSKNRSTPPADLAYAIAQGVMLPPVSISEPACLRRLMAALRAIEPARMGDAFLASLSSRELAYRSALGSHAVAAHFLETEEPVEDPNEPETDPEDFNVLQFERLKWGGVRHDQMIYELFDLESLLKLPVPEPTREDLAMFRGILDAATSLPPDATATHLARALKDVFPSTKAERSTLIIILSLAGVLSYPGYQHRYDKTVPPPKRRYRDSEWGIPAMFWRGEDGVQRVHLSRYFSRHFTALGIAEV